MLPPDPLPSEKKIYFAQRDHSIPMELSYYYAPNFGPVPNGDADLLAGYDHGNIGAGEDQNLITDFYNKMGNASDNRGVTPQMKLNVDDRYARNYPSVGPTSLDAAPDYYSTILKMNTKPTADPNFPLTLQQYLENSRNNLISVDKAKGGIVKTEISYPRIQEHGRGSLFNSPHSNWLPIPSGSSNADQVPNPNNSNNTVQSASSEQSSTTEAVRYVNLTKNLTPGGFHESHGHQPDHGIHPYLAGRPPIPTQRSRLRNLLHSRFRQQGSHVNVNGHYVGKIINRPKELPEASSSLLHQHQHHSPHHQTRRPLHTHTHTQQSPSFPQFMNGLMNSVSEFFSRLG